MLYHILDLLERLYHPPGFGVVHYLTFRAAAAAITALIIAFWLGPKIIHILREKQIGESAKVEAPKTHLAKAGTPTMGGLIVLSALVVPTLSGRICRNMYVVLILFVTVVLGGVGIPGRLFESGEEETEGTDRTIQNRRAGALSASSSGASFISFPQWIDADLWKVSSSTTVPFFKHLEFDFGRLYIPLVIFIITAMSNAVNLTDGLDGLAIGIVGIVGLTLGVISYVSGNIVWSEYLTIPYLRGKRRAGRLLRGAGRGARWGFSGSTPIRRRCSWVTRVRLRSEALSARCAS